MSNQDIVKVLSEKISNLDMILAEIDADRVANTEIMIFDELVKYSGIRKDLLVELKERDKIPFYEKDGRTYFYREDIDRWLKKHRLNRKKAKVVTVDYFESKSAV